MRVDSCGGGRPFLLLEERELHTITPGQVAFQRCTELAELGNFQWESITPEARAIWEAVAASAIEVHRGLNACSCKRPSINS